MRVSILIIIIVTSRSSSSSSLTDTGDGIEPSPAVCPHRQPASRLSWLPFVFCVAYLVCVLFCIERSATQPVSPQMFHASRKRERRRMDGGRSGILQETSSTRLQHHRVRCPSPSCPTDKKKQKIITAAIFYSFSLYRSITIYIIYFLRLLPSTSISISRSHVLSAAPDPKDIIPDPLNDYRLRSHPLLFPPFSTLNEILFFKYFYIFLHSLSTPFYIFIDIYIYVCILYSTHFYRFYSYYILVPLTPSPSHIYTANFLQSFYICIYISTYVSL